MSTAHNPVDDIAPDLHRMWPVGPLCQYTVRLLTLDAFQLRSGDSLLEAYIIFPIKYKNSN